MANKEKTLPESASLEKVENDLKVVKKSFSTEITDTSQTQNTPKKNKGLFLFF